MSAAASCLLTEDQFLCSICLDVFTDPVAIACGHNFCKTCITEHWDKNVQCQCPNCKEVVDSRPSLQVNSLISEMVAQFRQSAQQKVSSSSEQQVSEPVKVPPDVGSRNNLKVLLFLLVFLMFVFMVWMVLDQKKYVVVLLKEDYEGKKAELEKTEAEIQQMIEKRRVKIEEIKHSVELSKEDADRETAEGVQVFSALKESVERSQAELIDTIKEKQRKTEKQAEGFIKELEQEISELKKSSTEVEQLLQSEDHLLILQSFTSLKTSPPTRDWTEVNFHPPSYVGTVRRAVNQLEEILNQETTNLLLAELKRVQRFAVDLTLDPDTANPRLILSDDGKQVSCGNVVLMNLPDNTERFYGWPCVLAKQSFSSGRFYYEVQVKGKAYWFLGVARESIKKGNITLTPQGGWWTIWVLNDNKYRAGAGPPVQLSLKSRPEKVGVFVDYEGGLVSFYDVDAAALIYSFTGCSFTEKLYPYFSPLLGENGENSAPLIISPVSHTK